MFREGRKGKTYKVKTLPADPWSGERGGGSGEGEACSTRDEIIYCNFSAPFFLVFLFSSGVMPRLGEACCIDYTSQYDRAG